MLESFINSYKLSDKEQPSKSPSGYWMLSYPANYKEQLKMSGAMTGGISPLDIEQVAGIACIMDLELLKNKDWETTVLVTGLIETIQEYKAIIRAVEFDEAQRHIKNYMGVLAIATRAGGISNVDERIGKMTLHKVLVDVDLDYGEYNIGKIEKRNVN